MPAILISIFKILLSILFIKPTYLGTEYADEISPTCSSLTAHRDTYHIMALVKQAFNPVISS